MLSDYDMEIVEYWMDDLVKEHPGLPLEILEAEYKDTLGAISNEKLWAMGSDTEEEAEIHYGAAELNIAYSNMLKEKALDMYDVVW